MQLLPHGQHIHIIGIGGSGMSAIARVLLQKGYRVSGSDKHVGETTRVLEAQGATVYEGHAATNINGADALIITSAVPRGHVEVEAAHAAGIPVYKRSDVIAEIMRGQRTIAVAGVHGKTTTTSMIAHILVKTARDPSYIIGGTLRTTGYNAAYGQGGAFVIEADEYDHMFLGLRPQTAIITSVEWDHPDFFPTPKSMHDSFKRFAALVPSGGILIACADDKGARDLALARRALGATVILYGTGSDSAEWRASGIVVTPQETRFDVWRGGARLGEARLRVPGTHNILNALAALAATDGEGVPFSEAAAALMSFEGAGRRFDVRGEADGVIVIDDYAHHPTAIKATLAAARARYPDYALWAVWQPHTYTRTQMLFDDYICAFGDADHVLVTDIYAAREQPMPGMNSGVVVAAMTHADARYTPTLADATAALLRDVSAPAVILIMSAGDAPQVGIEYLEKKTKSPYASTPPSLS
jgi:UDP-N-acetylmuramate--alanine ligase